MLKVVVMLKAVTFPKH